MFRAYLDESSEKQDAVFAVGGFVGNEREWVALQSLWLSALPQGVEYFHATDCFGGREQFRGMDILRRFPPTAGTGSRRTMRAPGAPSNQNRE